MRRLLLLLLLAGCVTGRDPKTQKLSARESRLSELEQRIADEKAQGKDDYESEWRAAQLCAELSDEVKENRSRTEREEFAKRGVGHADRAIKLLPTAVEGHFYRLISLGRLEDAQRLPSPSLVADMRDEGERTARLDERFECAGAHRFLGLFYSQAPESGPFGYGSIEKAEGHFTKALAIVSDCPENLLAYAHFQLEKMENADAARDLAKKALETVDTHPGLSPEERVHMKQDASALVDGK